MESENRKAGRNDQQSYLISFSACFPQTAPRVLRYSKFERPTTFMSSAFQKYERRDLLPSTADTECWVRNKALITHYPYTAKLPHSTQKYKVLDTRKWRCEPFGSVHKLTKKYLHIIRMSNGNVKRKLLFCQCAVPTFSYLRNLEAFDDAPALCFRTVSHNISEICSCRLLLVP